jgi:hypothetical protein
MFKEMTAFVVGAGAGVDISMPTGKQLIEEIEKRLTARPDDHGRSRGLHSARMNETIQKICSRRRADQMVLLGSAHSIAQGAHHMGSIDTYIHAHSHDENIKLVGKMAIVDTILDYERNCDLFIDWTRHPFNFKNEDKVRKSWLAVLMNLLVQNVTVEGNLDKIFNNIAIVNFNYDRCVEQYLYKSLQRSFGISEQRAAELMSKLLIHHPYGLIAEMVWKAQHKGLHLGGDPHDKLNVDLELLSHNIKTFNEEVEGSEGLDNMYDFLTEAPNVVFLGFHFHSQNVKLITPRSRDEPMARNAYASTFGRSGPEKAVIDGQLTKMFRDSSFLTRAHLDIAECRELLVDYGTTLTS